MRILSAKATNFASYKQLELDFTNRGLTLIQGATGSGKSTICDLVPWILFGRTAKDGVAAEVLRWPGNDITEGIVYLQTVTVARKRGPKSKDNDLCFWPTDGVVTRGKDLLDTQKLLESFLGFTSELYLAGAYFHEFSQTAAFFTTTAKNRRTICEQIVDLSLPKILSEKITEKRKDKQKQLDIIRGDSDRLSSVIDNLSKLMITRKIRANEWAHEQARKKTELKNKYVSFEQEKTEAVRTYRVAEAAYLKQAEEDPRCSECGAIKQKDHKHIRHNPFSSKIDAVLSKENTYLQQLYTLDKETNVHLEMYQELVESKREKTVELGMALSKESVASAVMADLHIIQDATSALRTTVIMDAIRNINHNTNRLLSTYFDAEISVEFAAEDADKLEVTITKDGNECSYTQLSKGQRQLLKLCFGVSIMKQASNNSGISFTQLFFDEALDGLDESLKIKAYKLLERLSTEYESIFVVEHSAELKSVFPSTIKVQLVSGESQIEEAR